MVFSPVGFRLLEEDFKNHCKIRTGQHYSLILIKNSGFATYARTVAEKDALIPQYKEGEDLLLMAWTGTYRTDIFLITKKNLEDFYKDKPKKKVARR